MENLLEFLNQQSGTRLLGYGFLFLCVLLIIGITVNNIIDIFLIRKSSESKKNPGNSQEFPEIPKFPEDRIETNS